MACEARAARGSLIYILEMISLRIEPRNFEDYLYITILYANHYLVTSSIFRYNYLLEIYKKKLYNHSQDERNIVYI